MIAYLSGQASVVEDYLVILVNGVGYQVYTQNTLLSKINDHPQIELYIYTHVREDALELFGFESPAQLKLFKLILSVSGVGPKTALSILDLGTNQVIDAVQNAKVNVLTKVPRVGKKLAQKIIIDLRSKLGSLKELNLSPKTNKQTELIQALEALGFDGTDAETILDQIEVETLSIQEAIKQAIKLLG